MTPEQRVKLIQDRMLEIGIEPQVPPEIVKCARTLENWMQMNGHKYWALMGVCDRRFAYQLEEIQTIVLKNPDPSR